MDKLIVGLGNPGIKYSHTRHNIGWEVFDYLNSSFKLQWKDKFKGQYAVHDTGAGKVYFLKPQTFMNLSGESVAPLLQFFKLSLEQTLVIHDELDLPFGVGTFKDGGGLAGHNGLKSISANCGGAAFKRLRLGIGRPLFGTVSDWVLSSYTADEQAVFRDYMEGAAAAVEMFIEQGFQKAASVYSKKDFIQNK